jgi:hypothetical protein
MGWRDNASFQLSLPLPVWRTRKAVFSRPSVFFLDLERVCFRLFSLSELRLLPKRASRWLAACLSVLWSVLAIEESAR